MNGEVGKVKRIHQGDSFRPGGKFKDGVEFHKNISWVMFEAFHVVKDKNKF